MEATLAGYSVLVIDDSDAARLITRRHLERSGCRVLDRATPLGATRTIAQERVDAVLIDLDMPVMKGDSFAALLRRNPRLSNIAVVLISGAPKDELHRAMDEASADGAVRKQNAQQFLVPTLLQAIRERRSVSVHPFIVKPTAPDRRAILDTPVDGIPRGELSQYRT